MQHPFNVESPYRGRLADLVTKVVDVDVRKRALEAERSALLAEAYELAELEGTRLVLPEPGSLAAELAAVQAQAGVVPVSASTNDLPQGPSQVLSQDLSLGQATGLPRGSVVWRDRAHRVVRAELAASLRVSEWCVGNDIAHAVDALERCPVLVAAQARGEVTEKHVRSVVEAGRIIGHRATEQVGTTLVDNNGVPLSEADAELEIKRRYALFDRALLPHAQSLTPKLLVPVAKRIAEKLAGVSFDDRHRIAKRDRHVWLTEQEDGMCHVSALLTSFEAHAIFDRLTQYGKRLQAADVAAAGSKKPGVAAAAGSTPSQTSGARQSSGGPARLSGAGPGDATPVLTEAGGNLIGVAATAALKRPLGEARADSLAALLLEGEIEEPAEGLMKRIGPRVTARVQVLVPVSLTGRLDGAPKPQAVAPRRGTASGTGSVGNTSNTSNTSNAGGTGGAAAAGDATSAGRAGSADHTSDNRNADVADVADASGSTGNADDADTTGSFDAVGSNASDMGEADVAGVAGDTDSTGHADGAGNTGNTGHSGSSNNSNNTGELGNAGGADPAGSTTGEAASGIGDGWFQPELVGVGPIDTETATLLSHDTPTWDMIMVDDGIRDHTCTCTCNREGSSNTASSGNAGPSDNDVHPGSSSTNGVGSNIDTLGDILTVDGYRVPAHIRRNLAARDLRCRFPGCDLPVYRCDIDHTIAAEDGGPTSTDNLGFLCRLCRRRHNLHYDDRRIMPTRSVLTL